MIMAGLAAVALQAQPTIRGGGAGNAASMITGKLPGAGIAQGARFAVTGKDLGPAEPVRRSFPLSAEPLEGASIKVSVGGSSIDAWMVLASANRLEAVLPSNTPTGTAEITVTYQDRTVTTSAEIVAARFGIATRSGLGYGAAVAQTEDNTEITPLAAARPGQRIVLTGTGLGPVTGDEAAGPITGDLATDLQIRIGGKPATVFAKGRSDTPGMDRVVVEVPEVAGCGVAVTASTDGVYTNFATIAVGAEGRCSDETGFSQADYDRIQPGGKYRTGSIDLSRSSMLVESFALGSQSASGSFQEWTATDVLATGGANIIPSIGSCTVIRAVDVEVSGTFQFTTLDAGPALTITGPKGSRTMAKREGIYSADLGQTIPIPGVPSTAFLDPGDYTVTGPGGTDVGAFSAKIKIGAAVEWTNRASISNVPRSEDLRITWTGGTDSEYIWIQGAAAVESTSQFVAFYCVERASAGQLTVPSYVLSQLPAAAQGILMLTSAPFRGGSRFEASGVDAAYITATSGSGRTVTYR